jgi:hypothetical protein
LAVVRKSEFAKIANVSKSNVTHWLRAGHISKPAVVGEGRTAMIDVELAMAQLKERLSVNERFGLNGLDTNLEPPPSVSAPRAPRDKPEQAPQVRVVPEGETGGTSEAIIKAEKAKQSILLTDRLNSEARARNGKYMDAQKGAGAMTRLADEMLKIFEGAFPEFASAHAAKFQIPQKGSLLLLREEFRKTRAQLAAVCASRAAETPPTVEDD